MSKLCMGCMEQYEEEYEICPYCGYVEGTKAAEALHINPRSILYNRYIVGKVLGCGGFGVTYIGWDTLLERKTAVKEYLPGEFSTRIPGQTQVTIFNGDKREQFEEGLGKFLEEARRLAKFHNLDSIVKIYDSFEENNTAYIVMEYLEGETLAERLKRERTISAEEAVSMMTPVIQSLQVVHRQEIIHRDIAPDNIFLTRDGKVKLIDFGAARYATTSHSRSLTIIIKPGYSPEEQYRSRGDQGSYTDVYAIGATLYRMIAGIIPPDALERRALVESKQKDMLKPISKYTKEIPKNRETAILNALNIRIEDRTQDMNALEEELTTEKPVKRKHGKIKKTDILKWPLWAKIITPVSAVTVVVLSILLATGVIGFDSMLQREIQIPDGMSRVPSVVNDDLDDAEKRLNEAELTYSITGKEYSDIITINYVLNQDINAGTIVQINTTLKIVVSGGAETKTVPNTEGADISEAKTILESLGFAVETAEEYSVLEKGSVISQSVEPGSEYEVGGTIVLVVSSGTDPEAVSEKKSVIMPDFTGKTYNDAMKQIEDLALIAKVTREYNGTVGKDKIISQSVKSGDEIMSGSTVEIVVSLGVETITVRDAQFKTESEAKTILEGQGLNIKVTYENSDTVAAGVVIRQTPSAGSSVSPGTEVDIVVSTGKEKLNGYHTQTYNNGDIYSGNFVNSVRSGQGTYTWVNGVIFEGEFINGSPSGNGNYIYPTEAPTVPSATKAPVVTPKPTEAPKKETPPAVTPKPTEKPAETPKIELPIEKLENISSIRAGYNHSFAIKNDGSLWAWGYDFYNSGFNRGSPVKIMDEVTAFAVGNGNMMAIKTGGSLWTWGNNWAGQTGNGTTVSPESPVKIMDGVTSINAGGHHDMAIKNDGSLWIWGYNGSGQLGDGKKNNDPNEGINNKRLVPFKLMNDVIAVSGGEEHSMAIKNDNTLWAWGANWQGSLGDGTVEGRSIPVKIMDSVKAISAGRAHSMAIKTDGSLWVWGSNEFGQSGDGSEDYEIYNPVKIMDGVKEISAGGNHSLALKTDGTLCAWGKNEFGQIGDGTAKNKSKPVKIMNDVKEISAGENHSMAIKTDGSLWVWGSNEQGQLGDGTKVNRLTPAKWVDPYKKARSLSGVIGNKKALMFPEYISGGISTFSEYENSKSLFDYNENEVSKYCTDQLPYWAKWKYDKKYVVTGIIFRTGNDSEWMPRRMGDGYTISGSNDGISWEVIYTGKENDTENMNDLYYFIDLLGNKKAFQYYQLFSANSGIPAEDGGYNDGIIIQYSMLILCCDSD